MMTQWGRIGEDGPVGTAAERFISTVFLLFVACLVVLLCIAVWKG